MTVDNKIRNFLNSLPGVFAADSPAHVLRMAWGACGVKCSVGDFTDSLWRYGFTPEQLGAKWILRLPSRPMRAPDNTAKLRNIVGRGQR